MRYTTSARRQQSFATVTATCALATLRVDNGTAKDATIEDVTPFLGEKSAELVVNDETKKYAIQHNTKSGHTWIRVYSNIDEILEGTRAIYVTNNDPLGDETTMSDCLDMGLEMIIQGDNRLEEFNNKIVKPLLEVLKRCSKDLGYGGKQKQARKCLTKLGLDTSQPANVEANLAKAITSVKSYLRQCESTSYKENVDSRASRARRVFSKMRLGELDPTSHPADGISTFCKLKACCVDTKCWKGTKPIYLANTMRYQADGGLSGGLYLSWALWQLSSNPKDYEMARQIWNTQKVPFDPQVYYYQEKIRPALNWLVKVDDNSFDNRNLIQAWKDKVTDTFCRRSLKLNDYLERLLREFRNYSRPECVQIIERHLQLLSGTVNWSDENILKKHAEWVETGRAIAESQNLEKMNEFVEQSALKDAWNKIKWSDKGLKTASKGPLTSYGQRLNTANKELSAAELLDLGYQALEIKLKSLVLTHWIDSIDAAVRNNSQSVDLATIGQKEDLITPLLEEILGFEGL